LRLPSLNLSPFDLRRNHGHREGKKAQQDVQNNYFFFVMILLLYPVVIGTARFLHVDYFFFGVHHILLILMLQFAELI